MTQRDLTAGLESATRADTVTPVLLAYFDFSDGIIRLWSGIGDLIWDGGTWSGVGALGGITEVEETALLKAAGISYTLSGIPSSTLAIALEQNYQGREARMYIGALDGNNKLIVDPYPIFKGRMDVMTIDEDGETAQITVSVENELIDLERPRQFRYTPEDHKTFFPGDTFFDEVAGLQDAQIKWGRG